MKNRVRFFGILGVCLAILLALMLSMYELGQRSNSQLTEGTHTNQLNKDDSELQSNNEGKEEVSSKPEGNVNNQNKPVDGIEDDSTVINEEIIASYLDKMTLEDKIAQMFIVAIDDLTGVKNTTIAGNIAEKSFDKRSVGGVILKKENIIDEQQIINLNSGLTEISRNKLGLIPFVSIDEEGGSIVRIADNPNFPVQNVGPMADIGKTNDINLAYQVGEQIGKYLYKYGFNVDFAPIADVLLNDKNTVIGDRSFGSDALLVSEMVEKEIEGLHNQNIAATVKHFPGHGFSVEDSHVGLAVSNRTLEEIKHNELIPFQAGIDKGVEFVMVGHIAFPNILGDMTPASLSEYIMTDLLRNEMNFKGIIITDALNMGAITNNYSTKEAVVQTINAGTDMILMTEDFHAAYEDLVRAVKNGDILESRIDDSVKRIIELKLKIEMNRSNDHVVEWDGFNSVLLSISRAIPGTSGSSLKSAKTAAQLLDWLESNHQVTEEMMRNQIKLCLVENFNSSEIESISLGWESVYKDALKIINNEEWILNTLTDAGYKRQYESYDSNNLDRFKLTIEENINH